MIGRTIISLLFLSSCIDPIDTFTQTTAEPVFQGSDKLWAHRVNDPDEANNKLNDFNGIEIDLVFEETEGMFDVRHDIDGSKSNHTLNMYFHQLANASQFYYWLDLKNLDPKNKAGVTQRLNLILDKYDLRDNVIVESKDGASLGYLGQSRIKTSFWVTAFRYNLNDPAASSSEAQDIAKVLQQYKFNALSAHYPMVEFLTYHFPKASIHIWTNGLSSEEDKQLIRGFSRIKNIKVILVDYHQNFLNT